MAQMSEFFKGISVCVYVCAHESTINVFFCPSCRRNIRFRDNESKCETLIKCSAFSNCLILHLFCSWFCLLLFYIR